MAGEMFGVMARLAVGSRPPGTPIVPSFLVDNQSGTGLRVSWAIEKTRTPAPDTARVTVHNLLPQYRKLLSELSIAPGRIAVELAIGWRGAGVPAPAATPLGLADVLFTGLGWKVIPEEQQGPDVVTTIEAGDGLEPSDTPPQGGSELALGIQLAVARVLGMMKLVPSPAAIAEVAKAAATTGITTMQITWDADPRDTCDLLMSSIGLSWKAVGSEFVVFTAGLRNDILPAILAPQSGLTRYSEQDDGGIDFEALAQARVVPGCQVTFLSHLGIMIGGGPMRVETIRFDGSTDGPSLMAGTARKVEVF